MVMFDLPVSKKVDRKRYTSFRKDLIKNGFRMMQFSIYYRVCSGMDMVKKYEKRIVKFVPPNGEVRLLVLTEKQFNSMQILVGKRSTQELIESRQLRLL